MLPRTYKMVLSMDYEKQVICSKSETDDKTKSGGNKKTPDKVTLIVNNWIGSNNLVNDKG
jgi:hypothetical protein